MLAQLGIVSPSPTSSVASIPNPVTAGAVVSVAEELHPFHAVLSVAQLYWDGVPVTPSISKASSTPIGIDEYDSVGA